MTFLCCRYRQCHSLKFGGSKWAFGGDSGTIVIEDRHGKRLGWALTLMIASAESDICWGRPEFSILVTVCKEAPNPRRFRHSPGTARTEEEAAEIGNEADSRRQTGQNAWRLVLQLRPLLVHAVPFTLQISHVHDVVWTSASRRSRFHVRLEYECVPAVRRGRALWWGKPYAICLAHCYS